jgi:membrane protease YdiL (CAAX protease family)
VFRTLHPNHVLRLGARIVFMLVLFVIPGWSVFPDLIDTLASRQEPLLDTKQLIGSAVGLSMLALGGVGYLVRRDARAAFERLGLRMPRPAHYAVVVLGVIGLYLLNVGMEAFQRQVFPDLWEHDQRVNQMLVGGLGVGGGLLLGVCAGLGEELAMRGALQPRLGLIATAFLFSILHVQYSWVGILTIFVLGITLGVIRDRTSTTVAILVHAIYDMAAVFTAGVSGNP